MPRRRLRAEPPEFPQIDIEMTLLRDDICKVIAPLMVSLAGYRLRVSFPSLACRTRKLSARSGSDNRHNDTGFIS